MKVMKKLKKNGFGGTAKITECPECGSDDNTKTGALKNREDSDFCESEHY